VGDVPSWRANHITSRWRAVGGHLRVIGATLQFEPHGFDRALAARDWSATADEITAVGVAPRRLASHFSGAGLRRQLYVDAGGETAYFVVNSVERVAEEIRDALGIA
jgi:hypothetical protein